MSSILENLNEQQQKAVLTTEGPVLILAGAGSGKTRVLTHRMAYLIEKCGVVPSSILAVTFTNKAAQEMKIRSLQLLKESWIVNNQPTIATFHSFGVKVLRREAHHLNYNNDFLIYDASDQKMLIKEILKELDIEYKAYNVNSVISHISNAKSNFIFPTQYSQEAQSQFDEIISLIYPLYQKKLKERQAMDFDDLIVQPVILFKKHPSVLQHYQNMLQYFLIDEYQDTNQSQYQLTTLLAQTSRNICVVGDDDQSIYSWRGADVKNILEFEKDYPETIVIKLEQNYRSTKTILKAASSIIRINRKRKEKTLWTNNEAGDNIKYYEALHEADEARFIAKEILQLCYQGKNEIQYKDIAILYRTNAQSRVFEDIFLRDGIPYQIIGGTKFYERKEIKDLLSFFRFLHNPYDKICFDRIVNLPPRGIGKTALEKFNIFFAQQNDPNYLNTLKNVDAIPGLQKAATKGFKSFLHIIEESKTLSQKVPLTELFDQLLKKIGLIEYLRDGTDEAEERINNILEFRNILEEYSEIVPGEALRLFLEEVALLTDVDKMSDEKNQITLITTHAVKGLEFPVVFMVGMEDGLFPHSRTFMDPVAIEEERRLCYVGITRAKKKLYFTLAEQRTLYGEHQNTIPSRFFADIPEDIIQPLHEKSWSYSPIQKPYATKNKLRETEGFSVTQDLYQDGDRVHHASFGEGIVVQTKGDEISIAFDKGGIKHLMASIAPLEKI